MHVQSCCFVELNLLLFAIFVTVAVIDELLRTLRSDDGDGNGNTTKAIGLISKTKILHVHHAFLFISLPSLHDYDVKMPNFTLTEEVHKRRRNFLSLSELEYGSQEFAFRRVNLHLTKLVTWSSRDED